MAVAYTANIGVTRRPRWSHRSKATTKIHQADTEAYKKAHGSKKRAPAGIREAKVEVDKDELSKLMSVGTELAKEIHLTVLPYDTNLNVNDKQFP